jgi:hypothetical protein
MADRNHLKLLRQGVEVWNVWKEKHSKIDVDLSGANLNHAVLNKANLVDSILRGAELNHAKLHDTTLTGADCQEAQFEYADLVRAYLREANFKGANLANATLMSVDLQDADFMRANLMEATLFGAHFRSTVLYEADFRRAKFGWSIFTDTDLRSAIGLDSVSHLAPSYIDIHTIYKSAGNIPEVFLRGCGVPEDFITHMPSLVAGAQPIQFYSCFISYSHEDKSFARRLHDALQGRGIRCWLDEHQLLPGDKIYTEVDRGIRLWDKVLLCCSESALKKSWWVENEIQIAFDKEQQLRKQRGQDVLALIPLNLDGYLFDGWESGLATQIKSRLAADFTGWETDNSKFESEFEKLVRALRADAGGRESPPLSRL